MKAPRVVSLVPSATETLLALGVTPVACTRFCEQPGIPTVGGTKNPDVGAVVALEPDFVVVSDEENRFVDAAALRDAGIALHDMSPRSVADVGPAVATLARAVGTATPAPFDDWATWTARLPPPIGGRAAVLVWRRPWTSIAADTYGSSVLARLGVANVLADSPERYPETSLEELAALGPDLVVLPSEPYPFGPAHLDEVGAAVAGARVLCCDGRDLFWWGIRTPGAIDRLARELAPPE